MTLPTSLRWPRSRSPVVAHLVLVRRYARPRLRPLFACVMGCSVAALATEDTASPNEYLGTTVFFVPKHGADRDYGNHDSSRSFFKQQTRTTSSRRSSPIPAFGFVVGYQRIPRRASAVYGICGLMLQKGDHIIICPKGESDSLSSSLKTLFLQSNIKFPLSISPPGWPSTYLIAENSLPSLALHSIWKASNHAMERTAGSLGPPLPFLGKIHPSTPQRRALLPAVAHLILVRPYEHTPRSHPILLFVALLGIPSLARAGTKVRDGSPDSS